MKRITLVLVVAVAGALGALWWWGRASLPPLDGEVRLSGLRGPVEVVFDAHGVPHVYASGPEDAWFAAGALHARDRLWQMELYRRAAYGRLSEILGPTALPVDRRLLTLDLKAAAEAEWHGAAPSVREALVRYAEGVNAQQAQMTGRRRPIELQLLGVMPAPWTPVDSLAIGRLLAWRLAENHQAELVRHALAGRFGLTEAMRLAGSYPAGAPSVIQGLGGPNPAEAEPETLVSPVSSDPGEPPAEPSTPPGDRPTSGAASDSSLVQRLGHMVSASASRAASEAADAGVTWPRGLEWLHPGARRGGSNNWVLAGRRTASGRPLLANDPHLQIEMPGVWYELHLVAADLDVIGVTIPGAPFVVLGHNAHIAWGMTNSGADVQDLYVERIDVARRRYLYRGTWLPLQVTQALIPVRGGMPETFEIWRTRHGTVFAEVGLDWERAPAWLSPAAERQGERRAFALRWDAAGETAAAFEALNRARSWSDFTAAVERFAAPSQNFVYADVEGNIGYALSGVLPLRAGTSGMLPSDGTMGEGEWVGSVPPSSLPRLFNPARGYITSSNNLIDRQWPGVITRDWAAPYRTRRLHELIDAAGMVDLPAAASWQTDVTSVGAADLLAAIEPAFAAAGKNGDVGAAHVLSQLRAWDRRMDGRPVVTLYHLFEDALWRRTFADEMGEPLFSRFYEWAGGERHAGLYAIARDAGSRWWDDIATLNRRESRDDIVLLAAADTARRVASDLSASRGWSAAHAAVFAHPLSQAAAPLGWLFNRGPVPVVGSGDTVNRSSYHRLRPFAVWELASWRQIFDVGQWDASLVVLPTGQSGHPLSAHYFDQNELWRSGRYRPQPFSRAAVEAARAHRLLLVP